VTLMTASAAESCCPGCDETDGVEQTLSTPRGVAAWTCTRCGMNWAVTLVNHGRRAAYFEQLAGTVEQLGATRSVLRQVITLADDAATFPDSELRDRLAALARLVARSVTVPSPVAQSRPPGARIDPI
jgi:transposase-like protein